MCKIDHVKYKRNIFSSRMDAYMAASSKSQAPNIECNQRLKSDETAQVKNDFRQNSAHLNQMSFIPVYSSKTVCHKFTKSKNECENQSENTVSERKVLSNYSPPTRPRCAGDSDLFTARIAKTHMRRRSVGFEDMTSLTSYFGHNFTNDRRFQGSVNNSNISQQSPENHNSTTLSRELSSSAKHNLTSQKQESHVLGSFLHSDNAQPTEKMNQSENTSLSSWNHNTQLASGANANDHLRRTERPLLRYKDKSSKRKSSLNRMDFIQFPTPNTGNSQYPSDLSQKNSSSDEGSESRFPLKKTESPSGTSKRKHSASNTNSTISKPEVKTNEVNLKNSSPKAKSNLLPRSSQLSYASSRQTRWKQSTKFSQKLSHSAGELESLTDFSEVTSKNKTYMSAQEFDDQENPRVAFNSWTGVARHNFQKFSPRHIRKKENSLPLKNACDITSQVVNKTDSSSNVHSLLAKESNSNDISSVKKNCDISQTVDQRESINSEIHFEQLNCNDSLNSDVRSDCDDSKMQDTEIEASAIKLENLEIIENSSKIMDVYVSTDESGDGVGSDGERRRSSILRKKSSEEKKELHSILKPPPEDKSSKTPPSILKHRESSEEKDTLQPNDLHSILKKSTSEDESCNSGPDIRPILKLSTDEDSPSGILRPRPILKKRTSFSDECSYVSFPSGELKPILKKKTPLSSEDQPKPILKSRRKSEDTRSTTSEVITSRPRAYSADMGVKMSHESQNDNTDIKKDFRKVDSHDL